MFNGRNDPNEHLVPLDRYGDRMTQETCGMTRKKTDESKTNRELMEDIAYELETGIDIIRAVRPYGGLGRRPRLADTDQGTP